MKLNSQILFKEQQQMKNIEKQKKLMKIKINNEVEKNGKRKS